MGWLNLQKRPPRGVESAKCLAINGKTTDVSIRIADTFWARLRGLLGRHSLPKDQALWLHRCQAVHTVGMRFAIDVAFLDADGRVIRVVTALTPMRAASARGATSVLEMAAGAMCLRVGDVVSIEPAGRCRSQGGLAVTSEVCARSGAASIDRRLGKASIEGLAMAEALLALPMLLVAALGVIQLGMLWQGRMVVRAAVHAAAREGAIQHADPQAITWALARALIPLQGGAVSGVGDLPGAVLRSRAVFEAGDRLGWIELTQLSPTTASFADWAVPILDVHGRPVTGSAGAQTEIPAQVIRAGMPIVQPQSGASGSRDGLPIGIASQQTIVDAQVLKLHLRYGVPLSVPLIGPLVARTMLAWHGCGIPRLHRIGLFQMGWDRPFLEGSVQREDSRAMCMSLLAVDLQGHWSPRLPVQASATVRMMTPARKFASMLRDRPAGSGSAETAGSTSGTAALTASALGSFSAIDVTRPDRRAEPRPQLPCYGHNCVGMGSSRSLP